MTSESSLVFDPTSPSHIVIRPPAALADRLVVIVTISMLSTPFLVNLLRCLPQRKVPARVDAAPPDEDNPVIIAGFGRFGQIIGRILSSRGIPFTALDRDPGQIEFVGQFGNKVYFGDASRLDLLRAARADKASILVIAIDDIEASVKCAQIAKQQFPKLKIFARVRNRFHAYRLLDLGIRYVWRETFHSSADMRGESLRRWGFPSRRRRRRCVSSRRTTSVCCGAQRRITPTGKS